jgi:dTDP-glucose 4,6-dehydratase
VKVAVLGSNSFTGAHFVDLVLDRGDEVLAMSRSPEPHDVFLPYRWKGRRPPFLRLDLNRDLDALEAALRDARPDVVVNFASQSMVAQSWDHPAHWMQTNVVATVELHERLRKMDFLCRYVHVSTPEVYGSCTGLVGEDAPMNPSTPYAVSRAAADLSLRAYHKRYGFPVVFTRAANVFGPGQQLYRIVPRAALFAVAGRRMELHGGGRSVRSFIHVRDVCDATWRLCRQGRAGEVYHLSTTRHHSIREVVEEVCRQAGVRLQDLVDVADERPGHDAAYLLDSSRAKTELGWTATTSFEQGVAETLAWVREHRDTLLAQPLDYVHRP